MNLTVGVSGLGCLVAVRIVGVEMVEVVFVAVVTAVAVVVGLAVPVALVGAINSNEFYQFLRIHISFQ